VKLSGPIASMKLYFICPFVWSVLLVLLCCWSY
jgi:hypothetical protein